MIQKQYGGVQWLEFELLADVPIIHACLMRWGGISQGFLESLNLGRNVGDLPQHVEANYHKVAQSLLLTKIISARVCHGAAVSVITSSSIEEIPISDSLMTSLPNVAITVTQADCQAAIVYDPIAHAIANVHCGWRGNVQNIYAATVKSMQATYGSHPADLLVCVSPSLGPCHAEFVNHETELNESFWKFKSKGNHFDFWAISEWQLREAGILSNHIQIAKVDTYSNANYFSHRRSTHEQSTPCGRQATICALKAR